MPTDFGHLSMEFQDNLGVTVSAPVYVNVDETKTLVAIWADLQTLVSDYEKASDSYLVSASLKLRMPIVRTGMKTAPAATAENERTGLFNFKQSGSPYKDGIDIPAIADSLIVGGKINLADAIITALVSDLTVPFSSFTVVSTAIYALTALTDALLTFRKHRKAESRRSIEVA